MLIEIQFYWVFPFLLLFTKRYGSLYLLGLLLLFLLLRGMVWVDKGTVKGLSYWTIFGRADQFIVGIIAGLACRRLSPKGIARCGREHWPADYSALPSLRSLRKAG